ncbi:leptomycin B resistance protein pmd1 [Rhizoctonia solani AG-1 IA]|uniref:Leptomycin B resistance protein pmd1 n=1 Tax=Thanatephorus cucumeris (strain AG1-IA) TaxID=983506 RepID=L8WQT7_THACA|nr:leptomycin B resistance protein pmd1 [Rhizoctonia solani AG-1 IA]
MFKICYSGASFPIAGWLIGFVIEGLSIHDNDEQVLKEGRYWAMWFLVLSMVNIVSSFIAGFFLSMGGTRVDRRLRLVALSSLLRQEIGFFDQEENAAGSLTAGIASQAGHVSVAIGLVWQQLITSGGNFIGAFILGVVCKSITTAFFGSGLTLVIVSWKLALPSFAPVPAILVTAYFNIALLEKYEQTLHKPLEDASAFASENVDAIKTVAALGRESLVMEYFDKTSAQKTTKTKYLFGGALGFGFGIGSILILSAILMWWGVELYLTERISLKNLYATFEAVLIGAIAASRLFTYIPDMARMIQGFRAICNWEDRKPEIASLDAIKAPSLEKVRGEITFTSCTLQYASRPKPAIENLNLVIPAGPSGGGKSSIISMISRFYDPNLGTISLDGRDIRSIPLEEYRSHISLVAQDAVLYEDLACQGTFRENITLGQTSISQDEIERACRDANILSFIQSLPQGFDSPVGFKGSQMSGGQRQRICIARALLRNPSILLALDAESERSVQEALEQASKGRTTISIAHRLSTIQNADIIHVVEDGRIVESGSHVELLALNGRYVDYRWICTLDNVFQLRWLVGVGSCHLKERLFALYENTGSSPKSPRPIFMSASGRQHDDGLCRASLLKGGQENLKYMNEGKAFGEAPNKRHFNLSQTIGRSGSTQAPVLCNAPWPWELSPFSWFRCSACCGTKLVRNRLCRILEDSYHVNMIDGREYKLSTVMFEKGGFTSELVTG